MATTHEELSDLIPLIRVGFERLTELTGKPFEEMSGADVVPPVAGQELVDHLRDLSGESNRAFQLMNEAAVRGNASIKGISKENYDYLRSVIKPRREKLCAFAVAAFLEIEDISVTEVDASHENLPSYIRDEIIFALRVFEQILSDHSGDEESELSNSWKLLNSDYFKPEMWEDNERYLEPILLSVRSGALPIPITRRLREMHRSFLFGNYLAVHCMARALLEYGIRDVFSGKRALPCLAQERGSEWASIKAMVREACDTIGHEHEPIDRIREWGNLAIHPKEGDKIAEYPATRNVAIQNMSNLTLFLERIYR